MKRLHKILNTDFFPGLNRYVYWLKQPIGWYLLAALAALLIGLFHAWSGWLMFASLVAVIALQLVWPWVQLRFCTCELSVDRIRGQECEELEVSLKVCNRSPVPLWGLALAGGFANRLAGTPQETDSSLAVTLSRVPPLSTNTYRWKFTPERRGEYPAESAQIVTGFPFGIWHASRNVGKQGRCLVWPRTCRLRGVPAFASRGISAIGTMRDKSGDQGDVLGARIWREGESLRLVNWAQSAKTDEDLVLMERQTPSQPNVLVHLDLTPHGAANVQQEILDWKVRIAASLACHLHGHRHEITVGVGSRTRRLGSSRGALQEWLDELSLLDGVTAGECGFALPGCQTPLRWVVTGVDRNGVPPGNSSGTFQLLVVTREDLRHLQRTDNSLVVVIDEPEQDPFVALERGWKEWCRVCKVA